MLNSSLAYGNGGIFGPQDASGSAPFMWQGQMYYLPMVHEGQAMTPERAQMLIQQGTFRPQQAPGSGGVLNALTGAPTLNSTALPGTNPWYGGSSTANMPGAGNRPPPPPPGAPPTPFPPFYRPPPAPPGGPPTPFPPFPGGGVGPTGNPSFPFTGMPGGHIGPEMGNLSPPSVGMPGNHIGPEMGNPPGGEPYGEKDYRGNSPHEPNWVLSTGYQPNPARSSGQYYRNQKTGEMQLVYKTPGWEK